MKRLLRFLILLLFLSIVPTSGVTTAFASEEQSITDVMRDFAKEDKLDKDTVEKTKTYFSGNIGVLISAMIYIIFALTVFTTACDLVYISLPPARTLLYPNNKNKEVNSQSEEQSKSYCLISRDLRNLMSTNGNNVKVASYCKARGISIVVIVVVLILLVTTSLFTDLGFNIGEAILKFLGF